MARNRLPAALASLTAADRKNPQRHQGRATPKTRPLGNPPAGMPADQRKAWTRFASELPWLGRSDRALVQIASILVSRMWTDPQFPMAGFAQLRLCLAAMGGTPADRTKVPAPDGDEADPLDRFLQ